MLNLRTFFKVHLKDKEISQAELQSFSEDHLARLTADTTGPFTALVAPTAAAHVNFFGSISNRDVAAAVRQGLTIAVNDKMEEFIRLAQRRRGAVENAFGKESREYQEFYPHGIGEYSEATKATVEVLMNRLVAAGTAHQASLPAGFAMEFQDLFTAYVQLREAQLGKKGNVSNLQVENAAARHTLELQLTVNMYTIGSVHPGDVAKCISYFDQSILTDNSTSAPKDDAPTPA